MEDWSSGCEGKCLPFQWGIGVGALREAGKSMAGLAAVGLVPLLEGGRMGRKCCPGGRVRWGGMALYHAGSPCSAVGGRWALAAGRVPCSMGAGRRGACMTLWQGGTYSL